MNKFYPVKQFGLLVRVEGTIKDDSDAVSIPDWMFGNLKIRPNDPIFVTSNLNLAQPLSTIEILTLKPLSPNYLQFAYEANLHEEIRTSLQNYSILRDQQEITAFAFGVPIQFLVDSPHCSIGFVKERETNLRLGDMHVPRRQSFAVSDRRMSKKEDSTIDMNSVVKEKGLNLELIGNI